MYVYAYNIHMYVITEVRKNLGLDDIENGRVNKKNQHTNKLFSDTREDLFNFYDFNVSHRF